MDGLTVAICCPGAAVEAIPQRRKGNQLEQDCICNPNDSEKRSILSKCWALIHEILSTLRMLEYWKDPPSPGPGSSHCWVAGQFLFYRRTGQVTLLQARFGQLDPAGSNGRGQAVGIEEVEKNYNFKLPDYKDGQNLIKKYIKINYN